MTNGRKRRPGVKPRAEYEGNSISRSRPWLAEGVSRTSWYRLRRQIEWWETIENALRADQAETIEAG
jgi:hypothetical protein